MMDVRRYIQIQVKWDTFYRERNVIGYYWEFLSEPLEPIIDSRRSNHRSRWNTLLD